jgi:nitroreductase
MELDRTIKGRRSIRRYREEHIPDSLIEELLDLARYAPSSMNGQPWYFIVVRNDETKRQLVEIKNKHCPAEKRVYKADFLKNAPVVVVVCVDKERSFNRGVENAVLATANIMLGAYRRGLGSVYMSAYRRDDPSISEEIRQILGIPQNVDPITIVPLGYPDETPKPKTVRLLDEVVFYETFGKE